MDQLSSTQIEIMDYIEKNTYTDRATAFQLFSTTSDYSIGQLLVDGYLKEFNSVKAIEHKRNHMESLQFWIPIAIDTILSISAIAISIIALLQQ